MFDIIWRKESHPLVAPLKLDFRVTLSTWTSYSYSTNHSMKLATGILVLVAIIALAVDCLRPTGDQLCRDLAAQKHIDVSKVGPIHLNMVSLEIACPVYCRSFSLNFTFEYSPNPLPDPRLHLCCCGSTLDDAIARIVASHRASGDEWIGRNATHTFLRGTWVSHCVFANFGFQ